MHVLLSYWWNTSWNNKNSNGVVSNRARTRCRKIEQVSLWYIQKIQNMEYSVFRHSIIQILSAMSLRSLSLSAFTKTSLVACSWFILYQLFNAARAMWGILWQVFSMSSNTAFRTPRAQLSTFQSLPISSTTKFRTAIVIVAEMAS